MAAELGDQPIIAAEQAGPTGSFRMLPNEVLDLLLFHLDLTSVKRLRLTSATMAKRCEAPGFKRFFASKEIDLTEKSLTGILDLAIHPVFGPAVRNMTLVAVYYDPSRWAWAYRDSTRNSQTHKTSVAHQDLTQLGKMIQSRGNQTQWLIEEAVQTLTEVFKRLGSLHSLTLDTRTHQHPGTDIPTRQLPEGMDWHGLWHEAGRALNIVTKAMAKSRVRIATVSIMDGKAAFPVSGKVQSRTLHDLAAFLSQRDFAPSANAIRHLTLAFSTCTPTPNHAVQLDCSISDDILVCRPLSAHSARARDPLNFPGVADFLKLTPNLESLDLRMYNTLDGPPYPYYKVFVAIAAGVRLPNLKRLVLRGIWTSEGALLRFLRCHPTIEELDLRDIHITGATWDKTLTRFSRMRHLEKLHLENLWSSSERLLNLEPEDARFDDGLRGPGHSFPARRGTMVHTRDIGMEEVKAGLEFKQLTGAHGKGSRSLMGWIKHRRLTYGPPES